MSRLQQDPKLNVLILSPRREDCSIAQDLLSDAGIGTEVLNNSEELFERLKTLAAAIMISEEELDAKVQRQLLDWIEKQDAWSDIPIILITEERINPTSTKVLIERLEKVSNLSVMEKPISIIVLESVVKVAIRARIRQYQSREVIQNLNDQLQAKDDFISVASHELKTPLTTLKLSLQMKLHALDNNSRSVSKPEFLRTFFLSAHEQVNRLQRLVDDMLDVSRVENGKLSLKFSRCEIGEIVTNVARSFEGVAGNLGQILNLNIAKEIHGEWDRIRLEQVLTNLVSNALKYGEQKPVSIFVRSQGDQAIVEVVDDGLGISEEDQKKLFQKFERAKNTLHIQGMGLGLFISKQIMHMHEGDLTVESALGKGSTFRLTLPAKSLT